MRFALSTSQQNTTWDALLSVWRAADDIDVFESGWVFDHFYPIFSDSTGPCLEGWTVMAALAQATERLRVGNLVTGMVYRHPAILANMAATLDIVSGGRLELGIGAAWNEEEIDAYGMELGTLTERFDRFEEGLQVIVGLLTQETTSLAGSYFTLTDARCEPKPVQRPHPPICIGGSGERRTIPIAARYAQHLNLGAPDVATFQHKRDVLHARCADIGRNPGEITLSTLIQWRDATVDPSAIAERIAPYSDVGCDLVIVTLPSHDPKWLEPLAAALGSLPV
ncbi:MAG: LLM class F420-dependent oxidoreductase [Ilumatobacteraceae bacterium]